MRHTPYQAYSYSYPHKSAYRTLPQEQCLRTLWAEQDRSALFAYVHIPFCAMRCGFCNLFAMARPPQDLVERYLTQLLVQARALDAVLGQREFARFAVGGGTPSYLTATQLATLLESVQTILGIDLSSIPAGLEASPETVSPEKIAVCRANGIDRISLGVQSFVGSEMRALARPQQNEAVDQAIRCIRRAGIPTLNLDLIYGVAGQTVASLLASIDSALDYQPEELYLYPLYVRPQTGLGKVAQRKGVRSFDPIILAQDGDSRLQLYEAAREHLRARGYTPTSMRMFRAPHVAAQSGPAYTCQNDGMIGLGTGARSYARTLHYSTDYAVGRPQTLDIIKDYLSLAPERFASAWHGFALSEDEQRRRFVIQSLLTDPGLDCAEYSLRFGGDCLQDLPQLAELGELDLLHVEDKVLRLNDRGYAYADTIGPWLASDPVRTLMAQMGQAC